MSTAQLRAEIAIVKSRLVYARGQEVVVLAGLLITLQDSLLYRVDMEAKSIREFIAEVETVNKAA